MISFRFVEISDSGAKMTLSQRCGCIGEMLSDSGGQPAAHQNRRVESVCVVAVSHAFRHRESGVACTQRYNRFGLPLY